MSLHVVSKTILSSNILKPRYVATLSNIIAERSLHRNIKPIEPCCMASNYSNYRKYFRNLSVLKRYKSFSTKPESKNLLPVTSWYSFSNFSLKNHVSNETISDLRRFLSEVGTDPKEARFWLKHFTTVELKKPFAVFEIDPQLFNHPQQLEVLTSSLSFLHRNNMRPVVVFGSHSGTDPIVHQEDFQKLKSKTTLDMTVFTSLLESHGVKARPLFAGSGVIQAEQNNQKSYSGHITKINSDLIQWCLLTKHIPVISSLGETPSGQIVNVDLCLLTNKISRVLQPLKVMKINLTGGFVNEKRQVVPNIHLPADLESCVDKSWFTKELHKKTTDIYNLLCSLSCESSVVITSVNNLLKELFTHRGSGTFFKITEPIHVYKSFDGLDIENLKNLFNKSFQRNLKDCYLEDIKHQIDRIYLSQNYNAAAIILHDSTNIPYLCKLGVSAKAQGEGTGEILWDSVTRDYKQLYWRSRIDNIINSWYFKKSEGSWSNGNWTVFWYGVSEPSISTVLINNAMKKEQSFQIPVEKITA